MEEKRLKILNASAGSGKTYRLVQEYIELLVNDDQNHSKFSSIIAMTFTNKAALEMKVRIIKALDEISFPLVHNTQKLQLKIDIAKKIKIDVVEVEARCKLLLQNILHKYEDFHVLTIDKFNLRLIKSFSRDLNLPHDFEVVMNEKEIIEKIVDQLLNQMSFENTTELNTILIEYAKDNVEEGIGWNFRRKLIEFGNVLNSERNIPFVERLMLMDLSIERHKVLKSQLFALKNGYNIILVELAQILASESLDKSLLPGGGNTINDLNGLLKKTDFPTDKCPVTSRLAGNLEIEGDKYIPASIKQKVTKLVSFWEENIDEFITLKLFLKNYFNMSLLQHMAKELNEVKKGEQIIRISEFNLLISELIQQEDAPFIYERLGTKFSHFLLDEFQDTSHLQWLNLIPLIHESLSNGHSNLIVGDPKQSIYRFKNGVAEQFIELPGIYNPEKDPSLAVKSNYFKREGSVEELMDNWRSAPAIVNFNNQFFEHFKSAMAETAKGFYSSVRQEPKSEIAGRIRINSKVISEEVDLLPIIVDQIKESIEAGFEPNDICILGNTNIQCNQWAIGLNDVGYKVVSSDSLLIHSDVQVQLVIAYFKWRHRPSGENEKRQFAELYLRMNGLSYECYKEFIDNRKFQDKAFLSRYFESKETFFFRYENLYDLIQKFIQIAQLDELKNPYLHHLADYIYGYGVLHGPDLKDFLSEYQSKKNKIAVQIPESSDAIQVMTLHKSKGLEFPVVIIPSIDFKIAISKEHFVEVNDKLIYKQPSKNDTLQPIVDLYNEESNQIFIDDVNLCYVGMTRPISRLYITNYHKKDKFGAHFHRVLEKMKEAKLENDELTVDINDGLADSIHRSSSGEDLFHPKRIADRLWFPKIALQDKNELDDENYLSQEQQYGIQFHTLMSKINRIDDIDSILNQLEKEGEVQSADKDALRIDLNALFSSAEYSKFLDGYKYILSEQSILTSKNEVLRPDKMIVKDDETILIDFKTGLDRKKDSTQLNKYKSVLEKMGYPNVNCYLYYTLSKELKINN